jgi:NADP-dependent 3-hydroxy acid dehydrogenase YdfG
MSGLHGRAVVVTGAASGIGEALARVLAAEGARLLLADVDAPRLESVAQDLRGHGTVCLAQACDVADPGQVAALAERALAGLGGADILINNAGVALVAPVRGLALADAHWLMDVNFWGVVHGCRAFVPQLQARPGCVIVNVSSVFAMVSLPTQSIYNASKAAVRAFSDALREELRAPAAAGDLRHAVRVLCVHPGGIRTRLVEQARFGDPQALGTMIDGPQALQREFRRVARTSPEQAARSIVRALQGSGTRLVIGADARLGDWLYRLLPASASARVHALMRWRRTRSARSPRIEP